MQPIDSTLVLWLHGLTVSRPAAAGLVAWLANGGLVVLVALPIATFLWPGDGRPARRQAVLASFLATLIALALVEVLGRVIDRPRPFVLLGVPPLFPHAADSSFPSDHTLVGVALATPLLVRLPRLGVLAFALAVAIGLARVASAVHYPSDILGSLVLGLGSGLAGLVGLRLVGRFGGGRFRQPTRLSPGTEAEPTGRPPDWLVTLVTTSPSTAAELSRLLGTDGYDVDWCRPDNLAVSPTTWAVLIDGRDPQHDAVGTCARLRANGFAGPVLVILRGEAKEERIRALDAGANGAMSEPIDPHELLARLRAVSRRLQRVLPAAPGVT